MKTDILSDVLQAVRLSGAIFFDVQTSTPWVAQAPPSSEIADRVMPGSQHVIEYHVVVSGSGWSGLSDDPQSLVEFGPGSILVFPQGDSHMMSSDARLRTDPDFGIFEEPGAGARLPFHLTPGGGGPDGARLICGFLGCDIRPFNPLVQTLPRMIHVRDALTAEGGWLGQLIEATLRESSDQRLGGGGILTKLSELIFIEVVRRHAEGQDRAVAGWLNGLRDPQVGKALALIHGEPARAWTLTELAREVAMSRTILAERFSDHVGMPPMTYLFNWRMQLASRLLSTTAQPLAGIAASVGYDSESAFSRAFKRATGSAPARWRKQAAAKARLSRE